MAPRARDAESANNVNVPYGNLLGPAVVCWMLRFSTPYTRVFLCVFICTVHFCTCYFLLLSDDGNCFPETL